MSTTLDFYNNNVLINQLFYDSHKTLIMNMCIELKMIDRIEEFTSKYLGDAIKLKKKKDESRPKRPKSAFLYFSAEFRNNLIEKYRKTHSGTVKIGEIAKQLGKLWKKLSDKQKEKYVKMNDDDKQRYTQELETYNDK